MKIIYHDPKGKEEKYIIKNWENVSTTGNFIKEVKEVKEDGNRVRT